MGKDRTFSTLKMQALAATFKELRHPSAIDKLSAALIKSDVAKQSLNDITDILGELDPSVDSVAYLFVLHAALAKNGNRHEALLTGMYLSQFCAFCSVAGRSSNAPIARDLMYGVSRAVTVACTSLRSLQHILAAAQAICTIVSSSGSLLGTICQLHVDALQLTLLGAALSPPAERSSVLAFALPLMADSILFACEETSKVTLQHIQEHVFAYFYYSGCIFCGLSNFEAAADRFFLCLSAGAQGLNLAKEMRESLSGRDHFSGRDQASGRDHFSGRDQASPAANHEILEAAYKKLILACLLSENDDLSCLKHIPVARLVSYEGLISAFSTSKDKGKASLAVMRQAISRYQDAFEEDGNTELVMRLQDAYLLQAVRTSSSTHLAVDVLQLCSDLHLPSSVKIPDCIHALIHQARCVRAALLNFWLTSGRAS
jgi:hypothetical protein